MNGKWIIAYPFQLEPHILGLQLNGTYTLIFEKMDSKFRIKVKRKRLPSKQIVLN